MSKLPKYVLPEMGDFFAHEVATVAVYGPLLEKHTSQLSAVVSVFRYTSKAYHYNERTLGCIEAGEFSLGEVIALAQQHKNIYKSTIWTLDEPSRAFVKAECNVKTRPISKTEIKDAHVRYSVESIKHELNARSFIPPSLGSYVRTSDAAVLADLKSYDPTRLETVSLRLLATAMANVASKMRTKSEPILYYYDESFHIHFLTREEAWDRYDEQQRLEQNWAKSPKPESREMQEARRMGRYMQATNYLGDRPKT